MKKALVFLVNTLGPSLIVIAIYVYDISIVNAVKPILSQNLVNKLSINSIRIPIDTALFVLCFNLLISVFKQPAYIKISMKNRDKTPITIIPLGTVGKSKKIDMEIKINYKWIWLKRLIQKFGGIVKIYNTDWTSLQIDNLDAFDNNAINDVFSKEYIIIHLDKLMGVAEKMSEVDITCIVTSNVSSPRNGTIVVSLEFKRKIVGWLCKNLFFDISICRHPISSR